MVQKIDANSFNDEVLNSGKVTVLDFYADWCGPCRKLSPIMDEIEQELSDKVKFTKVNTDENVELAQTFQISGIPTLLVFKDGQVVERMVGLMPKDSIITNIERYM